MKDVETLYEERKNLNQKLIELDNEINNCKVADILNKFQIGKFTPFSPVKMHYSLDADSVSSCYILTIVSSHY